MYTCIVGSLITVFPHLDFSICSAEEHKADCESGLVIYDLDMPALKPETALQKKLETLERHKAMMDSLAMFLKAHSKIAAKCSIHPLQGKVGLKFDEFALVVPYVKKGGGFVLKLIKSGDDWRTKSDSENFVERVASGDVSDMSDDELEKLLDSIYREINPDSEEENEEG
jgi:hypothetical protein